MQREDESCHTGSSWTARFKTFAGTLPGALTITIGVAGLAYLIVVQPAVLVTLLPFSVLLLCPLMHVFMHRGHGGHGAHGDQDNTGYIVREQRVREEVNALERDKARVGPFISGH
jgi:hypothetical protein